MQGTERSQNRIILLIMMSILTNSFEQQGGKDVFRQFSGKFNCFRCFKKFYKQYSYYDLFRVPTIFSRYIVSLFQDNNIRLKTVRVTVWQCIQLRFVVSSQYI